MVAEELKLSRKEVDDVRVGALLYDLGHVEITTQLLSRAVDTLEATASRTTSYTFSGVELVHSLSSVLNSAVPLLLTQDDAVRSCLTSEAGESVAEGIPLGAKIIRAVRAYDAIVHGEASVAAGTKPGHAIQELRRDISAGYDPDVLDAIERCVRRVGRAPALSPAHAGSA
jgi:response regulator RpfG family c-di-GMP phosphodiesterase